MTSQDVAAAITAGNEAMLQWYAITHETSIPGNPNAPVASFPLPGGGGVTIQNNTVLVLGALAIVALLVFSK